MVSDTHIPADRNGLKFHLHHGEISKIDEAAILAALRRAPRRGNAALSHLSDCGVLWIAHYVAAFGATALAKLKIGVWSRSAVKRDSWIHCNSSCTFCPSKPRTLWWLADGFA